MSCSSCQKNKQLNQNNSVARPKLNISQSQSASNNFVQSPLFSPINENEVKDDNASKFQIPKVLPPLKG